MRSRTEYRPGSHYFTLYSQAPMPTFKRLLGFLRPYRRAVLGSLAFAWLAMGLTVLIPWLVGETIDSIEPPGVDRDAILPLVLAILGAGVLRLGLTVVRRLIAGRVSVAVEFDLRERMYGRLQELELGFFDSQQTGQLMSRATVDLQSIRFFLGYGLIFLTQNALTIVLASAVMFVINPWLAALALLPVPFVVLTAMRFSRLSRPALQEVQQRLAELTAEAEESVSGIRVVKAFAREEHMLGRFQNSVSRVFDQNVYSTRLRAFYSPFLGFLPSIGLAVVLFVGGREVIAGGLTIGEFTAFYTYLLMLQGPMRMLGVSLGMAQRAVASGNRMFEILDREPRIESAPGAPPLPAGPGAVEFHDVTLRYAGAEEPALKGVSLAVEPGTTVALVGPTGSGKTSLVALLARLYDPSVGSVSIDGANVREVDVESLRGEVAFVADDSFLFSASVAENIAYARPEATREEIERAARLAQASGIHRAAARRIRDAGGRPRADLVGRAASAGGHRPRAAGRSADPDPGRRHVVGGRPHGGRDQAGAPGGDGRADDLRGRASAVDDLAGGRDRGDGRGPDGRPGDA